MAQALLVSPTSGTALALQETLVELIDLSLHAKQAHWNVEGPLFRPLHELFDELAASHREWYDEVAERLQAIGCRPDGRVGTVAARTPLSPLPEGSLADQSVVGLIEDRVDLVATRTRARLRGLEEHDPVTQDLLIGIVQGLEKQAWMLRASRS